MKLSEIMRLLPYKNDIRCPRPERSAWGGAGRDRATPVGKEQNDRKPIRQILQIESDGFYLFFSAAVQDEFVHLVRFGPVSCLRSVPTV